MKYLIVLFFFTSLFLASQNGFAAAPKIDTMYASFIYSTSVLDSMQAVPALGKPDSVFVTFGNAALLDLKFKNHAGTDFIPIKAISNNSNSELWIWAKKDASVDSSAGQVVFSNDDNGYFSSKPFILQDGLNKIPVPANPNGDFSYVELSLAEPDPHAANYAKSFFIDAIALLQDTTTPPVSVAVEAFSPSIASYPNPFVTNTTIRLALANAGEVQFAIIDGLGREVDHIDAGYLETGVHEMPLAIRTPGFYFVRLFINGQSIGSPLKITSR